MKNAKIIIGQVDSSLTARLSGRLAGGEFEVHVAERGDRVLEILKMGRPPDLVVMEAALLDPGPLEICRSIKSNPSFSTIPILLVAPGSPLSDQASAVQAGCDDIVDSTSGDVLLARMRSLLRLKAVTEEWDDAESVLYTLARTIEAKDPHTLGHADRVAHYAVQLGQALGVTGGELDVLRKGGMLHDLGKIAVPDGILLKPGRYTPEEFEIMKRHPVLGCEICEKLRSMRESLPLIRHHHERLDGSGYPAGLKGDEIPALVRIISVVDIYDALRSQRSYKEAFSLDKSISILWEEAGKGWWDKTIVAAWETIVRAGKGDPFPTV